MSKEEEVCANCGIPALDDVKLKKCACKLVKYCSVECTEGHRERHDEDCKKRQKELHDDIYLRSPISAILGSVHSASCRCRSRYKNHHFIRAAVPMFVMAVFMPISRATGIIAMTGAHFVESRTYKKVTRE